jgi:hypothetical protein
MQEWRAFMKKYYPDGNLSGWYNVYACAVAQTLAHVLKQCGEELTRDNVMRQATSIKNLQPPVLLPGIRINTSSLDYRVIRQVQLQRFDQAVGALRREFWTIAERALLQSPGRSKLPRIAAPPQAARVNDTTSRPNGDKIAID